MAEYELIQQRNISGKGILKVPTDVRKNRAYILYASVFRKPSSEYLNFSYNPPRSRYGNLVFLRDGYVIKTTPIEFKNQVYDGVNDISGQTLLALKCAYDGILESIYRLSTNLAATPGSIGLTPVNYTNGIADYVNLRLAWDECRLSCYADTAIQLSLYRLVYDVCNADFNADITPPIPEPVTEIPSGTPIEGIDPAYDDDNDDGNTIPYPGDSPPAPAQNRCIRIRNKGLYSGDIIFESFLCADHVVLEDGGNIDGRATVNIVVYNVAGAEVSRSNQASWADNPVEYITVTSTAGRLPQYSFGDCSSCL